MLQPATPSNPTASERSDSLDIAPSGGRATGSVRRAFLIETLEWIAERDDSDGLEQFIEAGLAPYRFAADLSESSRDLEVTPVALARDLALVIARHVPEARLSTLVRMVNGVKGSIITCELETEDDERKDAAQAAATFAAAAIVGEQLQGAA